MFKLSYLLEGNEVINTGHYCILHFDKQTTINSVYRDFKHWKQLIISHCEKLPVFENYIDLHIYIIQSTYICIQGFQLSCFVKLKTVILFKTVFKVYFCEMPFLYVINRKIHGCLETQDLLHVLSRLRHSFPSLHLEIPCSTHKLNLVFPRAHMDTYNRPTFMENFHCSHCSHVTDQWKLCQNFLQSF